MGRILVSSILILLLAVSVYIYWYYYNPYSDGYREGVLQKFSRKGNLFKTYEGEMIQMGFGQRGTTFGAQYFYFSVADEKLADSLENSLGKVVKLHYTQYRRSLPWRGEEYKQTNAEKGQYVVDEIAAVKNASY